jgi:hypothetical protein
MLNHYFDVSAHLPFRPFEDLGKCHTSLLGNRNKDLNVLRMSIYFHQITPSFAAKYAGPDGSNFEYTEEQKEVFRNDPTAQRN